MRLHVSRAAIRFALPALVVGGLVAVSLVLPSHSRFSLGAIPLGYGYGFGSSPQPFVASLNPTDGQPTGGQSVAITGNNFNAGATAKFGSVPAPLVVNSSTSATATSPPQAAEGIVNVSVSNTGGGTWVKTNAYAYLKGVYQMDAFGGMHVSSSAGAPVTNGPLFSTKLGRGAVLFSTGVNGFVLDGWGGLHPFTTGSNPMPTQPSNFPYWPNFDIARDVVLVNGTLASNASGYILDGWGGIHPFGSAPAVTNFAYFPGNDVAKRMFLFSDGKGGYVLDAWGGIHPFATAGNALPAAITNFGYWPNFNIARDFALIPSSTEAGAAGFTLDGWGGLHVFNSSGVTPPTTPGDFPYWPNFDIARAVRLAPNTTGSNPQGWILEGYGGLHEFGDAPALAPFPYYPGNDVARQLALQ
jgi:hypothetical protein